MSLYRHAALALAALLALTGCATTQTSTAVATHARHERHPPDVHGDPLALFPAGAVMWTRADAATLRASPHFEAGMQLARDLGADFATVERELGFDPFQHAERVAFAVYLPPGETATAGWPLVYARGGFQRDAVLASARAHAANATPTETADEGLSFTVIGERAYVFPADDVMLVMERALVHRVAARLAGATSRTVLTDDRFQSLWAAIGGMEGPFALAAELAAMRGRVRLQGQPPEAEALDSVVVRGAAPDDVTLRAAGLGRDEAAAAMIERTLREARDEVAGQLSVRLLGLSRLLNEGVHTTVDGRVVRANVDGSAADVRRLLRATSLLHELLGR